MDRAGGQRGLCSVVIRSRGRRQSRRSMRAQGRRGGEEEDTVGREDNDAILCIGYSAHIRGRILRVDLSLSSLLGMHVRRLAIMHARARESRPEREVTDGLAHGLRGRDTMRAYTSGAYEREH